MTVAEKLRSTLEQARAQLGGLEKGIEQLEKRARESLGEVRTQIEGLRGQLEEMPDQLKGAWSNVSDRVRGGLMFATRDELRALEEKMDALAARLEKVAKAKAKAARN